MVYIFTMKASGAKVNEYREIGQRIRYYREQADISQADLSRKIGFKSPTAVFFIEQGKRRVKVLDLVAISQVLGVTVDMLITGTEIVVKSQPKIRLEQYETTAASMIIQGGGISTPIPEFPSTEVERT